MSQKQIVVNTKASHDQARLLGGIVVKLRGASEEQYTQYNDLLHEQRVLEKGLQKAFARMELQMPLILSVFRYARATGTAQAAIPPCAEQSCCS